jgi:D-alanyl-lipoteichoic acid acyltransferase DltB (MBOAT superfamily)
MNRCVFNNYCFEGFWRSWHRGFNQWLIRYIFIPLGGSKTKIWNIWVVFTFVAIWHDFTLDLVVWAWFICAALIPEMVVKKWAQGQTHLWQNAWFTVQKNINIIDILWLRSHLLHLVDGAGQLDWFREWG